MAWETDVPRMKFERRVLPIACTCYKMVRRTICFSKTERMHDLVVGLFINRYEFGRLI